MNPRLRHQINLCSCNQCQQLVLLVSPSIAKIMITNTDDHLKLFSRRVAIGDPLLRRRFIGTPDLTGFESIRDWIFQRKFSQEMEARAKLELDMSNNYEDIMNTFQNTYPRNQQEILQAIYS